MTRLAQWLMALNAATKSQVSGTKDYNIQDGVKALTANFSSPRSLQHSFLTLELVDAKLI
jgi:hypothetical protein